MANETLDSTYNSEIGTGIGDNPKTPRNRWDDIKQLAQENAHTRELHEQILGSLTVNHAATQYINQSPTSNELVMGA